MRFLACYVLAFVNENVARWLCVENSEKGRAIWRSCETCAQEQKFQRLAERVERRDKCYSRWIYTSRSETTRETRLGVWSGWRLRTKKGRLWTNRLCGVAALSDPIVDVPESGNSTHGVRKHGRRVPFSRGRHSNTLRYPWQTLNGAPRIVRWHYTVYWARFWPTQPQHFSLCSERSPELSLAWLDYQIVRQRKFTAGESPRECKLAIRDSVIGPCAA